MLNPVRKLTDNMGGDEDQSIGFEPEEESTNFYHPGFGIKVALRNYAPVPHLLPILRHLRGNLFSFYRGNIRIIPIKTSLKKQRLKKMFSLYFLSSINQPCGCVQNNQKNP